MSSLSALPVTRQTKACKITRCVSIGFSASAMCAIATVRETKHLKTADHTETKLYHLKRIATDWGIGVEVQKQDDSGETYHVHLDRQLGDSCTCPAGVYRGTCRHLDMVREAHQRGLV